MQQKNYTIQALRAVAAMMVFLSHSLMMIKNSTIEWLHGTPLHFFFDGQCAVVFFMVLSGFFYYKAERFTLRKYARGIKKKVLKIYPSHVLMISIGVLLCNLALSYNADIFTEWSNSFWTQHIGIRETIKQMLIIVPGTDSYLVNSPVWYLVVEVRMFLLMPLLSGVLYYVRVKFNDISYYGLWTLLVIVASFVYPFALCYLIGYLAGSVLHSLNIESKILSNPAVLGGGFMSVLAINIRNEIQIESSVVYLLIQSLGVSSLILLCYMGKGQTSASLLARLGDYSYEFYISHFVILLGCKSIVSDAIQFWMFAFVLTVMMTVLLRHIHNRFINRLLQ